jgi:hypothetical protein
MRLTIVFLLALILLAPARAQNTAACTPMTTRGTYSVVCTGMMSPAAGAAPVPFSAIAVVRGDWGGAFSGGGKASIAGGIVDQTVKGTAAINSDCTGSIVYEQKINGQAVPSLNLSFQILEDGKELRAVSVDAGAAYACNLRLLNR